MTLVKEYTLAGVEITDEIVRCDEQVTIDGSTYYKGYLNHTCGETIADSTHGTHGAWNNAAHNDVKFDVFIDGSLPTTSSELMIEIQEGYVYATTQVDVWVDYLAHTPIYHNLGAGALMIPIDFLENGAAVEILRLKLPYFARFAYGSVNVRGNLPTANATITVKNADSGGESFNVTVDDTDTHPSPSEATDPLKITAAQELIVETSDGKGASDLILCLWDV